MNEVVFDCHGVSISGWHFLPEQENLRNARGLPCVVMAHGLGGTRDAGLEPFARCFAQAGLHALCIDYRYLGKSGGEPRQYFSVRAQLQDYAAAINYARELPEVDPQRIALWGYSFSGGHAVAAAVQDGKIAAVIAQAAFMDSRALLLYTIHQCGLDHMLKLWAYGFADAMRGTLGMRRVTLPVVGLPGENAVLTTPDAKPGYFAIAPPDFRNEITTDWIIGLASYRPGTMTPRLPCPALFCITTQDTIVPPSAMEEAARRAPDKVEVKRYPLGHFEICVPPAFDQISKDQTEFLTRVFKPG